MKDLKSLPQSLKQTANRILETVTLYRIAVLALIIGSAVSFALLRTREYIDIPRNETLYSEGVLQIKYKSIDEETLKLFQAQKDDQSIEVNPQYDLDRQNPFSE